MWDMIKGIMASLGLSSGGQKPPVGSDEECADGSSGEMLTCPEALERLFEFLDDELDPEDRRQVEVHMEICKRCYPRLQFERAFVETLRRTRAGQSTPTHVKKKVMDLLAREGLETA